MTDDLTRRALAAYFRTATGSLVHPDATSVREHQDRQYVVLENADGPIAVYRVTNQGQLKRLGRIPSWVS